MDMETQTGIRVRSDTTTDRERTPTNRNATEAEVSEREPTRTTGPDRVDDRINERVNEVPACPVPSQTSPPVTERGEIANHVEKPSHEDEQSNPLTPIPTRRDGLLFMLSHACRKNIRETTLTKILSYVYDNINMVFKSAEQILGRKDSQENGTCATAFPLFDTSPLDLETSKLLHSFDTAPELTREDITLTPTEQAKLTENLRHTVLRIIVNFGGERFQHFAPQLLEALPPSTDCIPIHKTTILPLPSMNIDESSITGNAEVLQTIFKEAEPSFTKPKFMDTVKIVWGDQLSAARVRSVIKTRAGHEAPHSSFLNCVCGPGLFHYQISAAGFLLETHWGEPGHGALNPGSLCFQNTRLDRKPITIKSPPPYRTCRNLIFVSLYARVFHCLQIVSNFQNLDNFAANVSFEQLQQYSAEIVTKFATPLVADDLREERYEELLDYQASHPDDEKCTGFTPTQGDMVHENAIYFLRDALVLREFTDAIKTGDSYRIILVLKILGLSYRGSGRTKYAYETLQFIHNYTHVWPTKLRYVFHHQSFQAC